MPILVSSKVDANKGTAIDMYLSKDNILLVVSTKLPTLEFNSNQELYATRA